MMPDGPRSSKAFRRDQVARRRLTEDEARAEFDALRAQHGLQIPGLSAVALLTMLHALQADRYRPLDTRGLVPCRVRLVDGAIVDPCVLWVSDWGSAAFIAAPRKLVGGQVARLVPSEYALPFRVFDAARHTHEYRMGSYVPVLAAIQGHAKYLVPAQARFFRCGSYKGRDLDPDFAAEPSETAQRLGRYVWGDDMVHSITAVAIELPPEAGR